jgi:hypothetical protein
VEDRLELAAELEDPDIQGKARDVCDGGTQQQPEKVEDSERFRFVWQLDCRTPRWHVLSIVRTGASA